MHGHSTALSSSTLAFRSSAPTSSTLSSSFQTSSGEWCTPTASTLQASPPQLFKYHLDPTTTLSVVLAVLVYELDEDGEYAEWYDVISIWLLPLMPVLSGMLITISSKFTPILKWSSLSNGNDEG